MGKKKQLTGEEFVKICVDANEKSEEEIAKNINIKNAELSIDKLTEKQRMIVFNKYCVYCGDKNPKCQCWNDE